ncbi:hypothetical protein ACHHYP_09989 [Achlya hypogyna]|uniref:Uncharacterized protein n=1 Tax=Achlya hypogyna TaxID=1202772 RepID=A0A1V9YM06_ACHHY|nr:hypothetical protein ACHHYP_09989 [Achlya hypogyna]
MGSALMVIASEPTNAESVVVDKKPEIFQATNEWREIPPGQHLPGGLWVRINLATGLKEARLLE